MPRHHGRMAEWLKVPPWKGGIRVLRIEGSNPSPSAKIQEAENDEFSASFALEFDHVSFSSIAYDRNASEGGRI